MVVYAFHLNNMEGLDSRIQVSGWPEQKARAYLKNNLKAKKVGVMAQVVECIRSKFKALSLYPNTAKKENKYKIQ
jgi:hypothetical protein